MAKLTFAFRRVFSQTQLDLGRAEPNWAKPKVIVEGETFPETMPNMTLRTITVRVTTHTETNENVRLFQFAHESVHCLFPRPRRDTIYIEEGLANWYSFTRSFPTLFRDASLAEMPEIFKEPYHLFLETDPNYAKVVELRKQCPALDDVSADQIKGAFRISDDLAEKLTRRLPHQRPERM